MYGLLHSWPPPPVTWNDPLVQQLRPYFDGSRPALRFNVVDGNPLDRASSGFGPASPQRPGDWVSAGPPGYARQSAASYIPYYNDFGNQGSDWRGGGYTPLPAPTDPVQYGIPEPPPPPAATAPVVPAKPKEIPPDGGFQGGAATGEGGSGAGAKVICQELVDQNKLCPELYRYDLTYAAALPHTVIDGYHLWARPYVRLMRRSALATALVRPAATAWAREAAHRACPARYPHGSRLGRLMLTVGEPLSAGIGWVLAVWRRAAAPA